MSGLEIVLWSCFAFVWLWIFVVGGLMVKVRRVEREIEESKKEFEEDAQAFLDRMSRVERANRPVETRHVPALDKDAGRDI